MVAASVLMLSFMLTGGFYVDPEAIPSLVRWYSNLGFISYSYPAVIINEISLLEFTCDTNFQEYSSCPVTGEEIISKSSKLAGSFGSNVFILLVIGLFVRLLGYFALRTRSKK